MKGKLAEIVIVGELNIYLDWQKKKKTIHRGNIANSNIMEKKLDSK